MKSRKTKSGKQNLMLGFVILLSIIVVVTVVGLCMARKQPLVLQGQVEASETRVSGKLPGRILELRVAEGQTVQAGDTLAVIESPEVDARLQQALAAEDAARMQSLKAVHGTREEQVAAAREMWQKALAGTELASKSLERVQNLFDKGVVPAQKRDEAEANYLASLATSNAAESQYRMAVNGAQSEDRLMAAAMVRRAQGAVAEVESYLPETTLTAPIAGEISEIFPRKGELIGTGAPVMNILDLKDAWVTFNLREDLLSKLAMGQKLEVKVPALGGKQIPVEITYIKAMAGYATWKATKVTGQYDARTFEVRARPVDPADGLRPGMTVLLEWDNI